ncbi:hypothetical protein Ppa06_21790 [Planomonospora parontospora subsp. parontospora]|uniref:Uncharacterized protein n=2 Tax=Planomonospora parontospora TaxID=58119 RepID=A0AA37BFW3_9ACTN|nr:hypothetical protein GCM10010126_26200 [Planomonospora parontospora]GII08381.1 hypothetical protein Ppa06_21790 [Planomonospora parontospora subsp. parontospora]
MVRTEWLGALRLGVARRGRREADGRRYAALFQEAAKGKIQARREISVTQNLCDAIKCEG